MPQMSPRKKAVLEAVVANYILNGEPVSSKFLCDELKFGVSPATLRNELLDLCEMGFLAQPHTSAGRVPTDEGFRFYVNGILAKRRLSDNAKSVIDNALSRLANDRENLTERAGRALSEIVGLPTVSAVFGNEETQVRRVSVHPLERNTAVVTLMTGNGAVGTRVCGGGFPLDAGAQSELERLLAESVEGRRVAELNMALLQRLSASLGAHTLAAAPVLSTVFELAHDLSRPKMFLSGEAKLLPYGVYYVQQLMTVSGKQSELSEIMTAANDPVEVLFGGDTGIAELKPFSIVLASYRIGSERTGRIGVIGPHRMNYDLLIPGIEYFAARLDNIAGADIKE